MQPISTTLLILGSQHSSPIKQYPLPFTASPSQPPFYSLFSKFEDSLSHILRCVYLFIYPWTLRLKLSPPVGHCEDCDQSHEHGYANTSSGPCFHIFEAYTRDPRSPSSQVAPRLAEVWESLLWTVAVTLLSWPPLTTGTAPKLWIPAFSIDKQSMFLKIAILGQSEHVGV